MLAEALSAMLRMRCQQAQGAVVAPSELLRVPSKAVGGCRQQKKQEVGTSGHTGRRSGGGRSPGQSVRRAPPFWYGGSELLPQEHSVHLSFCPPT